LLFLSVVYLLIEGCAFNNPQTKKMGISQPKDTKNVILITISSLRADHVSCLGYKRETTPNLDKFAKENILFTNAFATSSWQMPSTGSIFTSLYPTEHGATHINKKLDRQVRTIAEILKDNGFYTAGFCCNPRLQSESGFGKGFDFYDDYSAPMIISSLFFGQQDFFDINKKRTNDLINDVAIRWLANNTHKPFFLFIHYYDNHWDYMPPPPYNTLYDPDYGGEIDGTDIAREPLYSNKPRDEDVKHIIALYDGQVRQTDKDLGELLTFLEKQGIFGDSIIIVMADHGEQFYEHGHTSHHGIFDELIRIPLVVSVPGSDKPKKIDSLVSGVDILPTVLDLMAISIPSECQGKSLESVIEGKNTNIRNFVFIEYTGGAVPDSFAARFERHKFVSQEGEIFAYDLQKDPFEQRKIHQHNFKDQMNQLFRTVEDLLKRNFQILNN